RPGSVEVRVDIVGLQPGDKPEGLRLVAAGPDGKTAATALDECGLGCAHGPVAISAAGQWSFVVTATTGRGPINATVAAPLPTPDGRAALAQALNTLDGVRSVAMREDLRGSVGGPAVVSTYRFAAPNAFTIAVEGRQQVVIGGRS